MKKWRGNGERMRKWREIHSQDFLILCLFPPSLSISYIKNCHILSQNVKYGTFVANVTKNLTYVLWENDSWSNLLWESSASCQDLAGTHNYKHVWQNNKTMLDNAWNPCHCPLENGEYETGSEFEVILFSRFSTAARTTLFQRRMLTSCTRLQL